MKTNTYTVTYINIYGETLTLSCDIDTKVITFHHTDLHEGSAFESIDNIGNYIFSFGETDIIAAFFQTIEKLNK